MTHTATPHKSRAAAILSVVVLAAGTCRCAGDLRPSESGASPEANVLSLTEVFRVGDETAGDSLLLGTIRDMAVDSKGRLYVTESGFRPIRLFSRDGALVANIGQEGSGPGEFLATPSVQVGPGDSLYTWDYMTRRLSTFSPLDHSPASMMSPRLSDSGEFYPAEFLGVTNRGILFRYAAFAMSASEYLGGRVELVNLLGWDGAIVLDSIAQLPSRIDLFVETENSAVHGTLPFAVGPHFAVSADQVLYYGLDDSIHITGVPLQGNDALEFAVSHTPVPVTDAERYTLIADALDELRDMLRARLPEIKPAFTRLIPDDKGHLWIELTQRLGEETKTWLVVNQSGLVAGRTSVPQNVQLRVVRGNRAYGTMVEEETEAPIVVAWDISS